MNRREHTEHVDQAHRGVLGLTAYGKICLGIGVALVLLALGFRWVEFLLAGVGLVTAVAVSCVLGLFHSSAKSVRRVTPFGRVNAGSEIGVELVIGDTRSRSVAGLLVADHFNGKRIDLEPVERSADDVLYGEAPEPDATVFSHTIRSLKRGVHQLGPVHLIKTDPLGLIERRVELEGTVDVTVWPRRQRIGSAGAPARHDLDGPVNEYSPEGGMIFHAMREYEPGDDHRLIHWPSTAKRMGNELVVRKVLDPFRTHRVVVFDVGGSPGDFLEPAIEIVASIVETAFWLGKPVEFLSFDREQPLLGLEVSLDHMAKLQEPDEQHELAGLFRRLRLKCRNETTTTIVTVGRSHGELKQLLNHGLPGRVNVVAVGERGDAESEDEIARRGALVVDSLTRFIRTSAPMARQ